MRRSGPQKTRSRYQTPATLPGLRTACICPPSWERPSRGVEGDTWKVVGKVSPAYLLQTELLARREQCHRFADAPRASLRTFCDLDPDDKVAALEYEPNSATRFGVLCEPRAPSCASSDVEQR